MMSFLLNNSKFGDFIDCIYSYSIGLELKDTTLTAMTPYLDLDSDGRLRTNFYNREKYYKNISIKWIGFEMFALQREISDHS